MPKLKQISLKLYRLLHVVTAPCTDYDHSVTSFLFQSDSRHHFATCHVQHNIQQVLECTLARLVTHVIQQYDKPEFVINHLRDIPEIGRGFTRSIISYSCMVSSSKHFTRCVLSCTAGCRAGCRAVQDNRPMSLPIQPLMDQSGPTHFRSHTPSTSFQHLQIKVWKGQ